MTPYGGVELLLRSAQRSGSLRVLSAGIRREQVRTDGQMLLSLCLLNILGDDCVEDVDRLDADEGLCRQVGRHEARILRMSRRKLKRRHWEGSPAYISIAVLAAALAGTGTTTTLRIESGRRVKRMCRFRLLP